MKKDINSNDKSMYASNPLMLEGIEQNFSDTLQKRILANSAIYQQGADALMQARSQKHLLWELAVELRLAADEERAAAEALAIEALTAEGSVIDDCLARTVLIELYAGEPDKESLYETLCLETIALAPAFNEAWRDFQRQHNPGVLDSQIDVPRLDAFEHLIWFYEKRGDAAAALDIALQAQAAGYDEYRHYATSPQHEKSSRQSILLLWAFFAPITTVTAITYVQLLQQESAPFTIPSVIIIGLWIVTLLMLFSAKLRRMLLAVPRFLRRVPWLLWLILLEGLLLWGYQWEISHHNTPQRGYASWTLLWGLALLLFAGITQTEWRMMLHRLSKSRLTGLMISLTTMVLIMVGIELALRHVITFSNSYAIGLNHRRWMEHYELPQLNDLGYRDDWFDRPVAADTKRIFITGDSFASGFGVNQIEDTFPQLLDERLGDDYTVNLVAKPGWDTNLVLENVLDYPANPDLLIHSYFLNDIAYLDATQGNRFDNIFAKPPESLKPLIDNFYLAEVLYWNIYRQWLNGGDNNYSDLITTVYADDRLWKLHEGDLQRLVNWSKGRNADMVVLIWPVLIQPETSEYATRRVEAFFESIDIPVVNMSDYIDGLSPMELVVNPFDMHPGITAHHLAAEALYQKLEETGLIQTSE